MTVFAIEWAYPCHVLACAGIKLQPGVYHMVNPCEQSHISFNANKDEGGKEARRSPFFIDFSNVTLIQTVSPFRYSPVQGFCASYY